MRGSTDKEDIINLIYEAIDEYNSVVEKEIELDKKEDTLLFDPMSKLDSLGIVQVRTALDEIMERKYGLTTSVFSFSKEYPQEKPFRTVASTADYLIWYLETKHACK